MRSCDREIIEGVQKKELLLKSFYGQIFLKTIKKKQ